MSNTTRFIVLGLMTGSVLSCSSKPETTVDLLNAGSPKACIAEDVTNKLVANVMPPSDWPKGPSAAQYPRATFRIASASAINIKKAEHAMVCEAVLALTFDGPMPKISNTFSVIYEIEPDLMKNGDFIVKSNLSEIQSKVIDLFTSIGITSYPGQSNQS
ncbi:hypothetical protein KZX46_20905 [Polymorphobacter sp. PAMC 29334]|uniref:hypothetical protein n=1 Tax=Polymorphobacter sp. PAMC 29334 TaxID=2862331 RepID=UPI001C7725B7|nr:hypothetical protein [Polymorphobacter sp. PAMC 29334]QYE35139.1 hypothetical protein KZX46_20905 [Polymorphobacter sp. PAMC 29334]